MRPSFSDANGMRASVRPLVSIKLPSLFSLVVVLLTPILSGAPPVLAQTSTASTTTLAVTASGKAVTAVSAGTPVTLTASVRTGTATVTAGTVLFCDATAKLCSDVHEVGAASLTSEGTASLTFLPPPGNHSYNAYFTGSTTGSSQVDGVSTSSAVALDVTAASKTTLTETGSLGNYSLTATVTAEGPLGAPTGTVSFLDTSSSNASVGTATLGSGTSGALAWNNTQTPAVYSNTTPLPQSVAVGDFNGDGIPDLAVGTAGFISILLGNGDGTFQAPKSVPAFASNKYIAVGNFVAGGPLDVLVASDVASVSNSGETNTTPNLQLFIGDGKGGLTAQTAFTNGSGNLTGLATGYLDQSGHLGFIIAGTSYGVPVLNSYTGNGDGTFSGLLLPIAGMSAGPVAIGDFNGDGSQDLFVVSPTGIFVFQNNGLGDFTPNVGYISNVNSPTSTVVGDFNGDGKLDIAVTNGNTNSVTVYQGNGAGTFTLLSNTATGSTPVSLSVGDFNGDGIADLATANSDDNTVSILLGNGDGTFKAGVAIKVGDAPVSVAAADFANDGTDGFVTANSGGSTATIELSQISQTATGSSNVSLTAGTHLVEASYGGTSTYESSVSSTDSLNGPPATLSASISPTSLTFSGQAVGSTSAAQTVTLTNTGTGALSINSIAASTNFAETNTCGTSLASTAYCTVSVTFAPTVAGSVAGTLTVTTNVPNSPQTIALTGTGTSVTIQPSMSTLNISAAGGSATATISISSASGFTGAVNVACKVTYQGTGTPTDPPTCSLNPATGQVTATTPLTSTLTVATTGGAKGSAATAVWISGGTLASLFLFCFLPHRRCKNAILVTLVAIASTFIVTGCGSTPHTTAGSYQVVVTASSSTVTTSTTISLNVQ